jgi:hypothetical protein
MQAIVPLSLLNSMCRIGPEAYPDEHRHTIAVYQSALTFEGNNDIVTLIFLDLHSSQAIVTFCLFGLGAPERSSGVCGTEFGVEFVSLMFVAFVVYLELIAIGQ